MYGKSDVELEDGWKSESFELSITAARDFVTEERVRDRKTRFSEALGGDFDLSGENCEISSSSSVGSAIGDLRSLIFGHVDR